MFQDLNIDELLALREKKDIVLIDVRSPSEFREATIPGSYNIPLFDDAERAEVGTIYKQISNQAAKKRGLEIVSAKLPNFIEDFQGIEGQKVVFCWRGGMRSKTTATLLSLMDVHVCRLQGGVRAYRKWIVDQLEKIEVKAEPIVLNGFTGSGKTVILHKLEEMGHPVLDLEGIANHRGSIFGQIGLEPNNQKSFDALLVEKLIELQNAPYILFEAESKRIGKATMPQFLVDKKEQGFQVFVDMPVDERVRHIIEDYQPENHHAECLEAFRKIKNRIHTPIAAQIDADLSSGDYASGVRLLLEHYYDPRYKHTAEQFAQNRRITIQPKNADQAVEQIITILRTKFKTAVS